MADWIETKTGTSLCFCDVMRTAFLIIILLEKERVPRRCVKEILEAVQDILDFQEVAHTARNERHPSFPK